MYNEIFLQEVIKECGVEQSYLYFANLKVRK